MIVFAQLGPIAKSIPEIIKQASQSQLGILALLIIVLFGLAFYFFRKAPVRWRALIFLVFFLGVAGYAWAITRVATKPAAVHYVGRVIDKLTGTPLEESTVLVTVGNRSDPPRFTDSDGNFSFWIARTDPTQDAMLHFAHDNYEPYERIVSSDISNQLGDVRLTPTPNGVTNPPSEGSRGTAGQATPGAGSSAAARVGVIAAHPSATMTNTARPQGGARHAEPLPALAATARPPRIVEASSGPKLSGRGKDWSPWYQLKVGIAPAGYTIEKANFWLSGDRTCGAWAECREVRKDDTEVTWEFRLQGHDEWNAPPQAYSEGHLRAFYKPK